LVNIKKLKADMWTKSVFHYHTTRKESQVDSVKDGNEAEKGRKTSYLTGRRRKWRRILPMK
jgi:hypothetical protein